jgi:hypothetical protein
MAGLRQEDDFTITAICCVMYISPGIKRNRKIGQYVKKKR